MEWSGGMWMGGKGVLIRLNEKAGYSRSLKK